MDTSSSASSEGLWRCGVCSVASNQMTVLPCQHRFCDKCFNLWIGIYIDMYRGNGGRFPCQICWSLYEVPYNGLKAFKQDYSVMQLQAELDRLGMVQQQLQGASMDTSASPGAQASVTMATTMDATSNMDSTSMATSMGSTEAACMNSPGYCYRSHQLYGHMIWCLAASGTVLQSTGMHFDWHVRSIMASMLSCNIDDIVESVDW